MSHTIIVNVVIVVCLESSKMTPARLAIMLLLCAAVAVCVVAAPVGDVLDFGDGDVLDFSDIIFPSVDSDIFSIDLDWPT